MTVFAPGSMVLAPRWGADSRMPRLPTCGIALRLGLRGSAIDAIRPRRNNPFRLQHVFPERFGTLTKGSTTLAPLIDQHIWVEGPCR
jgi:hypothetical protein